MCIRDSLKDALADPQATPAQIAAAGWQALWPAARLRQRGGRKPHHAAAHHRRHVLGLGSLDQGVQRRDVVVLVGVHGAVEVDHHGVEVAARVEPADVGAEGVGRSTAKAVVVTSVAILVLDALTASLLANQLQG